MDCQKKNDAALLVEVKRLSGMDDDHAMVLLYHHFYQRLLVFTLSLVKLKEDAEEVVEDVLVKFWTNRPQIQQIENLALYLYKAARNQALNYIEKAERRVKNELLEESYYDFHVPTSGPSPLEQLVLAEMAQTVQVAVDNLPERCRLIFRMVREDGLKYKEVAEALNISVNTIDNQMATAVTRIMAALDFQKVAPGQKGSMRYKKTKLTSALSVSQA